MQAPDLFLQGMKQGQQVSMNIEEESSETKNYNISGEDVPFDFVKGKLNGVPSRKVVGLFTGKDGSDVASVPASSLIGPACVIDKTAETEADAGYLLTAADIEAWEAENGKIPDGAWLLLRTGWGSRAHDQDLFLNAGENGPGDVMPT